MVISFNELDTKYFPKFRATDYVPVADGCVMLLSAPGGVGKTYTIIRLLVKYLEENKTKKVCAWFSEDPQGLLAHRINCVVKDEFINITDVEDRLFFKVEKPFDFVFQEKGRSVVNEKTYEIMDELSSFDFIVFDPLLAFFGGSENDNSQARFMMQIFIDWALSENKTILFIHHSTKASKDNPSRTRGASAFADACRICYELESIKGSQNRTLRIVKDNWGANHYGFNSFAKDIKVIPDDTSRPKDTYEQPEDNFREYLLSWSEDRTYKYETSSYSFEAIASLVSAPVFYAAHGFDDGHRKAENANTQCDLAILDIDDGFSLSQAKKLFSGYKAMIATTKSHQKEKNGIVCDRFRVIIPFKEPISLSVDKFRSLMAEIHQTFPFVDTACKDKARAYTGYEGAEIYYTEGSEMIDADLYIRRSESRAKRKNELLELKYKHAPKTDTKEKLFNAVKTMFDDCYCDGNRNNTLARCALWMRDSELVTNLEAADYLRELNYSSGNPEDEKDFNLIIKTKLGC